MLEKTSIVRDHKGTYFIAKKIYLTDQQALNEIEMMRAIKHPNIVAFHDLIVEKEHLYLIEEFCEEGDLHFHIRRQIRKKRTYFSEEQVSKWLLQLLLAIEYLHNSKILHRDIRPQNIFLTTRGNLKLGSFRLSKVAYWSNLDIRRVTRFGYNRYRFTILHVSRIRLASGIRF